MQALSGTENQNGKQFQVSGGFDFIIGCNGRSENEKMMKMMRVRRTGTMSNMVMMTVVVGVVGLTMTTMIARGID